MSLFSSISTVRYWLEFFALPFFLVLIIHLSSHGFSGLFNTELSPIITLFIGIFCAIIFISLWHIPYLKKLVPCSHQHCHHTTSFIHIAAIVALCIHFFPESVIRKEMIETLDWGTFISLVGILGFSAHFLVDIIVSILLSLSFHSLFAKITSFLCITSVWFCAYFSPEIITNFLPETSEGIIFIIGAFLLSMFVHIPEKPKKCTDKHCH